MIALGFGIKRQKYVWAILTEDKNQQSNCYSTQSNTYLVLRKGPSFLHANTVEDTGGMNSMDASAKQKNHEFMFKILN